MLNNNWLPDTLIILKGGILDELLSSFKSHSVTWLHALVRMGYGVVSRRVLVRFGCCPQDRWLVEGKATEISS